MVVPSGTAAALPFIHATRNTISVLVASPALADLGWAAVFAGRDQGPCGAPAVEASLPGGRGRLTARARIGAAGRRVRHRPDECYESKVFGIRTMVGFTGVLAMSDDLLSKT